MASSSFTAALCRGGGSVAPTAAALLKANWSSRPVLPAARRMRSHLACQRFTSFSSFQSSCSLLTAKKQSLQHGSVVHLLTRVAQVHARGQHSWSTRPGPCPGRQQASWFTRSIVTCSALKSKSDEGSGTTGSGAQEPDVAPHKENKEGDQGRSLAEAVSEEGPGGVDETNCTADELHFVPVPDTEWQLALWRYRPVAGAPKRHHPVVLLAGLASNAYTFDLVAELSLARHLSSQGFDVWLTELRGNGLSKRGSKSGEEIEVEGFEAWFPSFKQWVPAGIDVDSYIQRLEQTFGSFKPFLGRYISRLRSMVTRGQRVLHLQQEFDWDFDSLLFEDVPAALKFIREQSKPVDGKVLGVGHSMGGILLYTTLATEGEQSGLAAVVSVASALHYADCGSALELILPLATPSQLLRVPAVPLGILMRSVNPLVKAAPEVWPITWLGQHVSARGMMEPELLAKVFSSNFGTISVKALLQLATVFDEGGLKSRGGSHSYQRWLKETRTPILALAGDCDTICPPEAVERTLEGFQEGVATYKKFGGNDETHYGHYDLVGGKKAPSEVFPVISDFLIKNDALPNNSKLVNRESVGAGQLEAVK